MFNPLKKQEITDFELRNPEANKKYNIREAKKELVKTIVLSTAALSVVIVTAAVVIKKLDDSSSEE